MASLFFLISGSFLSFGQADGKRCLRDTSHQVCSFVFEGDMVKSENRLKIDEELMI